MAFTCENAVYLCLLMIYLAPILGITDSMFRTVYARHFNGIDLAVSPFIPLVDGKKVKPRVISDLHPESNRIMPVIPQVIGYKPSQFIVMARALAELGYDSMNWNLGCPMKNVARKLRGAGLLPFPDIIEETLEAVLPYISLKLSVKIRLGYKSKEEIWEVIRALNRFPLDFVVIHPRTGIQEYTGHVDLDYFEKASKELQARVIYNGDLNDPQSHDSLKIRFPWINDWMVGRGLLYDLFLPERINGTISGSMEERKDRARDFHFELIDQIKQKRGSDRSKLNKIKEYWGFFHQMYRDGDKFYDGFKVENDLAEAEKLLEQYLLIAEPVR